MDTHTPVPNEKLSSWYFAIGHCKYVLQDRIATAEANGWGTDYDQAHLERIEDIEMFLKMSWDAYMDSLLGRAKVAMEGRDDG
jgi:hypothetical protein